MGDASLANVQRLHLDAKLCKMKVNVKPDMPNLY